MFFFLNPILIAAAVIPAIALLVYVYRADRLEKEPRSLLAALVFQGILSTILAVYTERLGTQLLPLVARKGTLLYQLLMNFVVIGLSEEGFKYLLLKRRTWNAPSFDCQFDGVVYAVFVSLGFALWENIDYVVMYGLSTALVRAVTAIPGHACFGVFMGAWYGLAKAHQKRGHAQYSKICLRLALLFPALLHGLYDFIATVDETSHAWYFVGFIALLFFASYKTIQHLSKRDRYI